MYENGDWREGIEVSLTKKDCCIFNSTNLAFTNFILGKSGVSKEHEIKNAYGLRVESCDDIETCLNLGDPEFCNSLFTVPYDRLFLHPARKVGDKAHLFHVHEKSDFYLQFMKLTWTSILNAYIEILSSLWFTKRIQNDVILETISIQPRIFKVHNFFDEIESEQIIYNAKTIQLESHRLKRSTTGFNNVRSNSRRTSESAFDTTSTTAIKIKKRAFRLLGIDPYDEMIADGLQVLRYNLTTAYINHMDWVEPSSEKDGHDYNTRKEGTNRYATILLYLTDVEEGGETAFPAFGLQVRPRRGSVLLFPSVLDDDVEQMDERSKHAGMPVKRGVKIAANVWGHQYDFEKASIWSCQDVNLGEGMTR